MSVVRQTSTEADDAFPSRPWENHTARFSAHWVASVAVITAHGELDASNAAQLADYFQRCTLHSKRLVLDLSGLEFFGTAGFSALHTINVRCAGADVRWEVVPGPAASRLLRICDPDNALPIAESPEAAVTTDESPRLLLKLVSQPR
ncbi:STAS domain-containing protein [Mycobacterium sp.]|uniref:STAS domain-containing protein n=1 Tax=Mycobacterium sp. TaxID=1785 RepID=UPI003D6A327B